MGLFASMPSKKPEYRWKEEKAERERSEADRHADRRAIIDALSTLNANDERRYRWERRRFALDVIAVIGAYIAAWFLFGQQRVLQGQLDETKLEQRPWVSVDLQPDGPFSYNADGGADIKLKITLQNTGRFPAISVEPLLRMYPSIFIPPFNFLEGQDQECRERVLPPVNKEKPVGFVLFPGAPFVMPYTVHLNKDDFERSKFILPSGKHVVNSIVPIIGGCFDYAFPEGGAHHQTGFVYFLKRRTSGEVFHPSEGDLAVENLRLEAWFEGFYAN